MKKIAIIGGSYLQLPIVNKAHEMGIETHCFSWQEGAVCADYADFFYPISIIDKEEILSVCQKVGIDGITTIASDTAVITVNYVASIMGLISNPVEYSEITTNKYKMRDCFTQHDIPSPQYLLIDNPSQYDISGMNYPLIAKPTDRSGSRGVEKISNSSMLNDAIQRACGESFEKKAIIEEFIIGKEVSVESISWEGEHYILQITDKVTTEEPYFVELEHHQPSSLPIDIQQQIKQIVLSALDALHVEYGASHSELKITEEGKIVVIEIGCRMGGDFIGSDLVRLSTEYDFLQGVVEIALGEFHKPVLTANNYSGVYFLAEETKGLKSIISNWKEYPEIVVAEITNNQLQTITCSGDRSGYLIYKIEEKQKADQFNHFLHTVL